MLSVMELALIRARIAAYGLAFMLVSVLSSSDTLLLFMYVGQAHFLLAYWYRFGTAKKAMSSPLLYVWLALVAIFFGLHAAFPAYYFWISLTALLFSIHFVNDELFLLGLPRRASTGLFLFGGIGVVFALETLQVVWSMVYPVALLIGLSVAVFALAYWETRHISMHRTAARYVLSFAAGSAFIVFFNNLFDPASIFGFFVLSHYFIWYFDYYARLKFQRKDTSQYVQRALGVTGAMGAIWVSNTQLLALGVQTLFFSQDYFYLWACLHILFTFLPRALQRPIALGLVKHA